LIKLPNPPDPPDQEDGSDTPTARALSSEFERLDLRSRSNAESGAAEELASKKLAGPHPDRPQFSRAASYGVVDVQTAKDAARAKWLRDGNVIYKSVGLGLMDLVVGNHMIMVARELGVGTTIEGF
jgi:hypothetical protein